MEDEKIDDHVDTSSCKHPADHQEEEEKEEEEEEEESEVMKMEKFYSLIRNYHDACNRLRSRKLPFACNEDEDDDGNNNVSVKDKKRRKTMGDDGGGEPSAAGGGGGGWVPCFELEDFGMEFKFGGGPPLLFPPPPSPPSNNTSKNIEKQDDGLGSLDLKLAQ